MKTVYRFTTIGLLVVSIPFALAQLPHPSSPYTKSAFPNQRDLKQSDLTNAFDFACKNIEIDWLRNGHVKRKLIDVWIFKTPLVRKSPPALHIDFNMDGAKSRTIRVDTMGMPGHVIVPIVALVKMHVTKNDIVGSLITARLSAFPAVDPRALLHYKFCNSYKLLSKEALDDEKVCFSSSFTLKSGDGSTQLSLSDLGPNDELIVKSIDDPVEASDTLWWAVPDVRDSDEYPFQENRPWPRWKYTGINSRYKTN